MKTLTVEEIEENISQGKIYLNEIKICPRIIRDIDENEAILPYAKDSEQKAKKIKELEGKLDNLILKAGRIVNGFVIPLTEKEYADLITPPTTQGKDK